jgi:hypothetical protein
MITLYSKTAVSGDIGGTVAMTGIPISGGPTSFAAIVRSYTTQGIDSHQQSTLAGGTGVPPYITASTVNEVQASFLGVEFSGSGSFTYSFTAGATNQTAVTATQFVMIGVEDWTLTAGQTPSGGVLSNPTGTTPTYLNVSVLLRASATLPTFASQSASWDLVTPLQAVNAVATSGAAQTIPDVTTAQMDTITLTAACTLTFPTAATGKRFRLALVQGGSGSYTVTWPGTVKWPGSTAPTLTTTVGKIDLFQFECFDGTNWLGLTQGQNF